jgi:hypothetical protein
MVFDFSEASVVKISQTAYVEDIVKEANITASISTPALFNLFEIGDSKNLAPEEVKTFHTRVAKLLYLGKRTRPDILLAVSFLTTRVTVPTVQDMQKLNRVIKYLHGTFSFGITLSHINIQTVIQFTDASYGSHVDGKSHGGTYITLGGGPILVKSTKQKLVARSPFEAELVAASDYAYDGLSFRRFLMAQGYTLNPVRMLQDNQGTITALNDGNTKSTRTKHINSRFFWMKQEIDNGNIDVSYVPTGDMIADILTKPLQGNKFVVLRDMLLNRNSNESLQT